MAEHHSASKNQIKKALYEKAGNSKKANNLKTNSGKKVHGASKKQISKHADKK